MSILISRSVNPVFLISVSIFCMFNFITTDNIRKRIGSQYANVFDSNVPSLYIGQMDTLRENIRKKMIEKGLNPYTLSEKSEVPQPTIQRFLSGKHGDPRSSTIQKLAKGLDATEAELRGFDNVLDSRIKTINELMSKLSSEQISSLELIIKSMVNPKHNSKNPPEPEKTQLTNAMEGRLTLAHEPDSETYERMANKK